MCKISLQMSNHLSMESLFFPPSQGTSSPAANEDEAKESLSFAKKAKEGRSRF